MRNQYILNVLSRLDLALLAEIELLQEGRFAELRQVQLETAEAMKGLDAIRMDLRVPGLDTASIENAMAVIRGRAQRARSLLASALHGARDARARLENIQASENQVGAYKANGSPVSMKNFASPYNKTL